MPEFPPRFMRPAEAAYYCGMGRALFEREIRQQLPHIKIGEQGIGFDRLDLDEALDNYKARNLKPCDPQQEATWQIEETASQGCTGTRKAAKVASTKGSAESAFDIALKQALDKKRKPGTSRPSATPKPSRPKRGSPA